MRGIAVIEFGKLCEYKVVRPEKMIMLGDDGDDELDGNKTLWNPFLRRAYHSNRIQINYRRNCKEYII